ncbi:hypothetical protein [uncultured archaeal virus]|uniref:Uncharacterized protein n=1 Tax=uncultured archaeal virus TaxID=1960247 RepID=A0A8B0LT15_9VIRU|nr:hypothetical protein [uncultured archaeal virus]
MPSLTKSVDRTRVIQGEIVTYFYDFFNDNTFFNVILKRIVDSRLGTIWTGDDTINTNSHKIISIETEMNECGINTNTAKAYYTAEPDVS